jgi:hypothetical protein
MSLLRLLTTGKSLVGLKDLESRYRVTTQRLLPQFGPTRNPFSSNGKSESAQTEARVPGADGRKGISVEGCGGKDSCEATRTALPSGVQDRTAPTSAGSHRFTEALRLRAVALLGGCKGKLTGMIGRVRVRESKPAIPHFTKPPVQGELSLDKIKVMRNDLSDADLEVIAARVPTAPAASPEPALPIDKEVGVAESRWRGATAGLFGAGKT